MKKITAVFISAALCLCYRAPAAADTAVSLSVAPDITAEQLSASRKVLIDDFEGEDGEVWLGGDGSLVERVTDDSVCGRGHMRISGTDNVSAELSTQLELTGSAGLCFAFYTPSEGAVLSVALSSGADLARAQRAVSPGSWQCAILDIRDLSFSDEATVRIALSAPGELSLSVDYVNACVIPSMAYSTPFLCDTYTSTGGDVTYGADMLFAADGRTPSLTSAPLAFAPTAEMNAVFVTLAAPEGAESVVMRFSADDGDFSDKTSVSRPLVQGVCTYTFPIPECDVLSAVRLSFPGRIRGEFVIYDIHFARVYEESYFAQASSTPAAAPMGLAGLEYGAHVFSAYPSQSSVAVDMVSLLSEAGDVVEHAYTSFSEAQLLSVEEKISALRAEGVAAYVELVYKCDLLPDPLSTQGSRLLYAATSLLVSRSFAPDGFFLTLINDSSGDARRYASALRDVYRGTASAPLPVALTVPEGVRAADLLLSVASMTDFAWDVRIVSSPGGKYTVRSDAKLYSLTDVSLDDIDLLADYLGGANMRLGEEARALFVSCPQELSAPELAFYFYKLSSLGVRGFYPALTNETQQLFASLPTTDGAELTREYLSRFSASSWAEVFDGLDTGAFSYVRVPAPSDTSASLPERYDTLYPTGPLIDGWTAGSRCRSLSVDFLREREVLSASFDFADITFPGRLVYTLPETRDCAGQVLYIGLYCDYLPAGSDSLDITISVRSQSLSVYGDAKIKSGETTFVRLDLTSCAQLVSFDSVVIGTENAHGTPRLCVEGIYLSGQLSGGQSTAADTAQSPASSSVQSYADTADASVAEEVSVPDVWIIVLVVFGIMFAGCGGVLFFLDRHQRKAGRK